MAFEVLQQMTAGINAIAVAIQPQVLYARGVPGFPNHIVLQPCDSLFCTASGQQMLATAGAE